MAEQDPGSVAFRWIGGANVPTMNGSRMMATFPFAVLRLVGGTVELRVVGGWLLRAERLQVGASDVEVVFPFRTRMSSGVGIRRTDGREYYFAALREEEVLARLSAAGFPVSSEPREVNAYRV